MPPIPSVADMFRHYPTGDPDAVTHKIGGSVEKNYADPKYTAYKNTCAIRVSYALNYAGDPIPPAGGGIANPLMKNKRIRTDKGGDGKWYIYSTYDLRAYLTGRYKHPKRFPGQATEADLSGVKGIIEFGFFHTDVWDGSKCAGHAYFGHPTVVTQEILVWESL